MKKNKLNAIIIVMLFISQLVISCSKTNERDDQIRKINEKNYNTMTAGEKKLFADNLISELKNDEDYTQYNLGLQKLINYHIALPSLKYEKKTIPLKSSDQIAYYRSIGISNPEDYFRIKVLIMKTAVVLHKRYPELYRLESKVRRHIMTDAARPVKVATALRLRKQSEKL